MRTWACNHLYCVRLIVVVCLLGSLPKLVVASEVVAWGRDVPSMTNVPAHLTNVTAIAAGMMHNLALKSDGRVVAWGYNNYGQTDMPAGLADVMAIAAGYFHSLALKSNGTVVAWGADTTSLSHFWRRLPQSGIEERRHSGGLG
ncbi:MAG: hypothetical protein DME26_08525 [Verrucomicrobia bacterium]|nr:MAG: hypothetical protein DME26_08525 [Verrucomicrobiota bacterium]